MNALKLLCYARELCMDESHHHADPWIQMALVSVWGIEFQVTKEGDLFNVRTCAEDEVYNLTLPGLGQYIFDALLARVC